MRQWIEAFGLALMLAATGCGARYFSAQTQVDVMVSPDGTCHASYSSEKEQQGLEASVCGGSVKVDKSGTLESVVAASLQSTLKMQEIMGQLLQMIPAAASMAAKSGS